MILIALGSNLKSETYGDPIKNCNKAMEFLEKRFELEKVSNFYETEPIPKSNQEMYVNGVVSIKTNFLPKKILSELMNIEKIFKRVRRLKNESRVIDIDIIDFNGKIKNKKSKNLILPHPRSHLRNFVLYPILQIDPNWSHPILKKNARFLINNLSQKSRIEITRLQKNVNVKL